MCASIRTWQPVLDIFKATRSLGSTPSSSPSGLMIRLSLPGRCFPRYVTLHRVRRKKNVLVFSLSLSPGVCTVLDRTFWVRLGVLKKYYVMLR